MPIEKGHIMMFARAIGDENPIYYDEEYAQDRLGGIIAPPTFIQSAAQFNPDNPLRPKIGEPWFGSGKTPTGIEKKENESKDSASTNMLHAEQHFEYHQPLKPGDVFDSRSYRGRKMGKRK